MPPVCTLITVLNYHGGETLLPCLASLVPQLEEGDALLVVDNGNETELLQSVRLRFPQILIITPPKNLGFAGGMNIGLRHGLTEGFDAVWIVNNDATSSQNALASLKRAANSYPGPQLFSPLILTSEGTPWFTGGDIDWLWMRTMHRRTLPTSTQPYRSQFLTGCALFIPRATLKTVGLLDERYFLYYEDADYSVRVSRQGGSLLVVPDAVVSHREVSQANPDKLYWLVRSGVVFFFRQARGPWYLVVRAVFWLRLTKNWLRRRLVTSPVAETLERAYTDALKEL